MSNLVNGTIRIVAAEIVIPYNGTWVADLNIDPDVAPAYSGKATVAFGNAGEQLVGTIDEGFSGAFGERATMRIVGGTNGWRRELPPQQFTSPAGVTLSAVVSSTAAAAGEAAIVEADDVLGEHYLRPKGLASSVLVGREWYVDLLGVTHVGPRPSSTPPAGAEVLEWDPGEQRAIISSDSLILPGTVFSGDDRFGSITVRDAIHRIDGGSFRVVALCGPKPATRLLAAMTSMVEALARVKHARQYKYRIVADVGTKLSLQAVGGTPDMPDSVQVDKWYGAHGVTEIATPGDEVMVSFAAGDPPQPYVSAYKGKPVLLTLDASTLVQVGTTAFPLAHALETIGALLAITSALGAVNSALGAKPPGGSVTWGPLAAVFAGPIGGLATAVASQLPTLPTTKLVAQ